MLMRGAELAHQTLTEITAEARAQKRHGGVRSRTPVLAGCAAWLGGQGECGAGAIFASSGRTVGWAAL